MDQENKRKPKNPKNMWKKGQSGNPSGRPKKWYDLKAVCEEKGFDPFILFIEVAQNDQNEPSVRVSAAKEVASRLLPSLKSIEVTRDDAEARLEELSKLREKMESLLTKNMNDY